MRRQRRFFLALLRMNIAVTVAYRGDFAIMQIGNLVVPLTSLLVWQAVLISGASLPVTGDYLVGYFLLVGVVEMLTSSWVAFFLAESIRDGSLNQWLVRPTSTHLNGVTNNLGEKVIKLFLLVPVLVVVAAVLSVTGFSDHRFQLPTEPLRWAGFLLAVIMAAAIRFALDVLIGSLAFWFSDVQGFLRTVAVLVPILSGAVVPLALLPDGWQGIAGVQPFRFMLSYPLEVLLGADAASSGGGFLGQFGWLVIFVVGAVLVWRAGLRSYSAAGA